MFPPTDETPVISSFSPHIPPHKIRKTASTSALHSPVASIISEFDSQASRSNSNASTSRKGSPFTSSFPIHSDQNQTIQITPGLLPTGRRAVSAGHENMNTLFSTHTGDLKPPSTNPTINSSSGTNHKTSTEPSHQMPSNIIPEINTQPEDLDLHDDSSSESDFLPALEPPPNFATASTLSVQNTIYESANGSEGIISNHSILEPKNFAVPPLSKSAVMDKTDNQEQHRNNNFDPSPNENTDLVPPLFPFVLSQSRSLSSIIDETPFNESRKPNQLVGLGLDIDIPIKSASTPSSPMRAHADRRQHDDIDSTPLIVSHVQPISPIPQKFSDQTPRQRNFSENSVQLLEERSRLGFDQIDTGTNDMDNKVPSLDVYGMNPASNHAVHPYKSMIDDSPAMPKSFSSGAISNMVPNINSGMKKSTTVPSSLTVAAMSGSESVPKGSHKKSFQLPDMFQRKPRNAQSQHQQPKSSLNFAQSLSMSRLRPRSKTQPSVSAPLLISSSAPASSVSPVVDPVRNMGLNNSLPYVPAHRQPIRANQGSSINMKSGLGLLHIPKSRQGTNNATTSNPTLFSSISSAPKTGSDADGPRSEGSHPFYHFNSNAVTADDTSDNLTPLSPRPIQNSNALADETGQSSSVSKNTPLLLEPKKSSGRALRLPVSFPLRPKTNKDTSENPPTEADSSTATNSQNRSNLSEVPITPPERPTTRPRGSSLVGLFEKVRSKSRRRKDGKKNTAVDSSASEAETDDDAEAAGFEESNSVPGSAPRASTSKSSTKKFNSSYFIGLCDPKSHSSNSNSAAGPSGVVPTENSYSNNNGNTSSSFERRHRHSLSPTRNASSSTRSNSFSPSRPDSSVRISDRSLSFGSAFTSLTGVLSSSTPSSSRRNSSSIHGDERSEQNIELDNENSTEHSFESQDTHTPANVPQRSRSNSVGEALLPSMPPIFTDEIPPLPLNPKVTTRRNRNRHRKSLSVDLGKPGGRPRAKSLGGIVDMRNAHLGGDLGMGISFDPKYAIGTGSLGSYRGSVALPTSSSEQRSSNSFNPAELRRYSHQPQHKRYSPVQEEEEEEEEQQDKYSNKFRHSDTLVDRKLLKDLDNAAFKFGTTPFTNLAVGEEADDDTLTIRAKSSFKKEKVDEPSSTVESKMVEQPPTAETSDSLKEPFVAELAKDIKYQVSTDTPKPEVLVFEGDSITEKAEKLSKDVDDFPEPESAVLEPTETPKSFTAQPESQNKLATNENSKDIKASPVVLKTSFANEISDISYPEVLKFPSTDVSAVPQSENEPIKLASSPPSSPTTTGLDVSSPFSVASPASHVNMPSGPTASLASYINETPDMVAATQPTKVMETHNPAVLTDSDSRTAAAVDKAEPHALVPSAATGPSGLNVNIHVDDENQQAKEFENIRKESTEVGEKQEQEDGNKDISKAPTKVPGTVPIISNSVEEANIVKALTKEDPAAVNVESQENIALDQKQDDHKMSEETPEQRVSDDADKLDEPTVATTPLMKTDTSNDDDDTNDKHTIQTSSKPDHQVYVSIFIFKLFMILQLFFL